MSGGLGLLFSRRGIMMHPAEGEGVADMSKTPLFLEAIEPLQLKLSTNSVYYSTDSKNWTQLAANAYSPTIGVGQRIYLKGVGSNYSTSAGIGTFSTTGKFNLDGNIMSLLYGDDFAEQVEIPKSYQFFSLFKASQVVRVGNILPATTLKSYCYANTFQDCALLQNSPILPALYVSEGAYSRMFQRCYALEEAGDVLAESIEGKQSCFAMYNTCSALIKSPYFYPRVVGHSCCSYMFQNCTSMVETNTILPAKDLVSSCYMAMYDGCINLENAPILPAESLTSSCYEALFRGCAKINYIKAMMKSIYSGSTNNWVQGVASQGVFVKNVAATWNTTGNNGVPSGWSIEYAES